MRTEGGTGESHPALLKLHSGTHLNRNGQGGTRTKIIHSKASHSRANITDSTKTSTQSTQREARRSPKLKKKWSCATLISYPGMPTNTPYSTGTRSVRDQMVKTGEAKGNQEATAADSDSTEQIADIPDSSQISTSVRRRSNGFGYRQPLESLLPTTAKEFDFDADEQDEEEREEQEKARSFKALQTENYNKMCKIEGITPCGRFKRQLTDCVADVSNSYLGTKDIKSICVSLATNVTIQELNLSCNDLGDNGAKYLAEALQENNTVEDLSLSQCNIDLEGLRALADVFLDMKPMKRLDLSKNKFERKHAEIISEVIQKNDYIEELVLSGNQIDDVGGVSLGQALGSNVGIKKLDLSWNHLRRNGAMAVCMALKFNQTIEELDLSWNGLAEEGCRALGLALPCNHTLKELDLTCNRINIVCLKELLTGLEKNDHLKMLRVDQNPMTTEGAIAMLKCLEKSTASDLTELYMTDIPINPEFLDHLDELLKVRTVRVYHRDPNNKKITPIIRQRTLKDYDPAMILFEYMKQENLRLIDLFRTFDTDSSQTVSKDELKEGFVTINMPLNDEALDSLFERLDLNDNDEIEYEEVKSGYRKTMTKCKRGTEDEHQVAALAGLRKLVQGALKERRKSMKANAAKKVLERRQSLTAVFKIGKQ